MDDGRAKLKSAESVGDKVMPSTSKRGRKSIKEQLERLRKDHGRLHGSVTEARSDLKTTLEQWAKLEQLLSDLEAWIRSTEEKIKNEAKPQSNLAEKKSQLEKAQRIQKV